MERLRGPQGLVESIAEHLPEARWQLMPCISTATPSATRRRRTRVAGAFRDAQSCLNLAAARLRRIAGAQGSPRKHMNMAPLRAAETAACGAATA